MTTSQDPSTTDKAQPHWQKKLAEFRARADGLFEAQRKRVDHLEASITEHLFSLDGSSSSSDADSSSSPQAAHEISADEVDELRSQLAQCRKLLNARASELKQLRSLVSVEAGETEGIDVEAILEQLSEMRLERDELVERLADAQRQVEQASSVDDEHFDDLQRRFETAVQEIRELKAKNTELQHSSSRQNDGDAVAPASSGFDWEQQKLLLMEQLDSDFDDSNPQDSEAKLSIESTIRITDQVIADKDRQITDLKAILEERSGQVDDQEAATLALASDDQIREELERLGRLEDQLREKLRVAEIDISVERAKLARERSELDVKLRALEESGEKGNGKQAGRWLSRLGLNDD